MFRTKICGVTRPADAAMIVDVGADAIGLNFYPRSKRYVEPAAAKEIAERVVGRLQLVGVFVNATSDEIAAVADQVGLTAIQIHGDEPPSAVATVAAATKLPVVRAQRFGEQGVNALTEDLAACQSAGRVPETLLVDAAAQSGEYGGAGVQLPWDRLELEQGNLADTPVVLAGGLDPDNVTEAIQTVGPYGVDVASGVESAPGMKDKELCERFVATAHAAFRQLGR